MRRRVLCFALILIAGLGCFLPTGDDKGGDSFSQQKAVIEGVITQLERREDAYYQFTITTDDDCILMSYYQSVEEPWELLGKTIEMKGQIGLPQEAGNPRTFDYRLYLKTRGISYTGTIESFTVKSTSVSSKYRLKGFLLSKRDVYLEKLQCGGLSEGLLRGILFGDKHDLEEGVYDEFRKNGTAHVLAVSGLHIGMLYSVYQKIYAWHRRPWITWTFICFLLLYGTVCLWTPSVVRAVGLILLVTAGELLHRRYDLVSALAAMAVFSIVKNPYIIYGASFQMSFLAVISIVFLQPFFEKLVGRFMATSFSVQVGLLPYMAYQFNYFSLTGILCNIPVVFLASILVPVGITGFFVFLMTGIMLPGLPAILDAMGNMMLWCNQLFTAEGILSFDVISPPLWLVILIYGLLFFLTSEHFRIYFYRKDWKKLAGPAVLIAVCVLAAGFRGDTPFDRADMVFVDVGQGDCVHVKAEQKTDVLIDGGGKTDYNVGQKVLKPYLLKNRIGNIDLAMATHLHTDHFLGLKELTETYPVEKLLLEGKAGQRVKLGQHCEIEILWPTVQNPDAEDENENSLIFMVHQKGVKTLITGDITAEGEAMLLKQYKHSDKLRADILKIAHHGSAYSTSDAFLEAVHPRIAVISVGKNNYGHPSDIVIEKLEKKGIMVFRTDLDGAVGIINRKGKISVCTEKQR